MQSNMNEFSSNDSSFNRSENPQTCSFFIRPTNIILWLQEILVAKAFSFSRQPITMYDLTSHKELFDFDVAASFFGSETVGS